MSLKLIEMQVALPRTFDAGKITDQLQQRGQAGFDQATNEMEKKLKKDRHSVIKMEQKEKIRLKDNTSSDVDPFTHDQLNERLNEETLIKEEHPYKGNSIDYSG
ncbi:hypothetical protein [Lederbergia lenta]|uniref:hypothetical protein n=1 Tax=Lederbergia lenta TaxID=1467 RepID=UPI00203F8C99|nr:hypothetical protein [Lederbergia lenta]MCM3110127.1 hypothetical protein [Lederbergia lenta]